MYADHWEFSVNCYTKDLPKNSHGVQSPVYKAGEDIWGHFSGEKSLSYIRRNMVYSVVYL